MTVSKTLTWQITAGTVDHYEIGISATAGATPTLLQTTPDNNVSATVIYDSTTYPTAWLFVRAISADGTTSDWSDAISADSLVPTYTPPQAFQYAYDNDVKDILSGITMSTTITDRMINKACREASRRIDTLTNRKFTTQTVVEKYNGTGTSELVLNHYPITKLNYVKVTDHSGLTLIREYDNSDLDLSDFESGMLQLKPIIMETLTDSWQQATALLYGHVFSPGRRNIEVSYEFGHLFYVEGEELQYLTSTTSGSTGITTRTYQAEHHNWSTNNIAIYQNGSLLTSGVTIETVKGIISVVGGADDDAITAYYYHTVPADIEAAAAKLAAIDILNQIAGKTTGGVTAFRNMNYQETYGTKPYNNILDSLQKDVDMIIQINKRFDIETA
jgi:hypothetical protein